MIELLYKMRKHCENLKHLKKNKKICKMEEEIQSTKKRLEMLKTNSKKVFELMAKQVST